MLPIPSKEFLLPDNYTTDPDPAVDALTNKIDEILGNLQADILRLLHIHDIAKMPTQFLDEAAYWLGITLSTGDSDQIKRKKLRNAAGARRTIGLWTQSIKPQIDTLTGASAALWATPSDDWWIMVEGDEGFLATFYWSTLGEGDTADGEGMILAEADIESVNPGNVYIDVGISTLTADQVAEIVAEIGSQVPPYIRIYPGYVSAGSFILYANGQIN